MIDAYDGSIVLYVYDPRTPSQDLAGHIPGLFTRPTKPPINQHPVRYPMGLFLIQSDIPDLPYERPQYYYNKEDVWRLSTQASTGDINAYYLIMRLVGEEKAEFALIAPFMPVGRDNMIAWMAGRSDPPNYGQLLVYQFPKQKLIFGPSQVAALIDQDPEIAAQLSLWTQRGSDVIRGDIMVIPLGDSLSTSSPCTSGRRTTTGTQAGHRLLRREGCLGRTVDEPSPRCCSGSRRGSPGEPPAAERKDPRRGS